MSDLKNKIILPNRITKTKIIAVEGQDEINFFNAYLKFLNFDLTDIDIIEVKGKTNFKIQIESLVKSSDFNKVNYLAIIRDSDSDANSAFNSIKSILRNNNLTSPVSMNSYSTGNPKTGIFIMPDNENKGALEDLCLKTVSNDKVMTCIDSFFACIDNKYDESEKEKIKKDNSKRKAQVFLSTRSELVNTIGLGAVKQYWNFNSEYLNSLKIFLSELQ